MGKILQQEVLVNYFNESGEESFLLIIVKKDENLRR